MRLKWENLLIVGAAAGITYLVLSLVSAMIPYEQAPGAYASADGSTTYVIQSLREAVLWPIGFVLFFGLLAVFATVVVRRRDLPIMANASLLRSFLGWTVTGILVLGFLSMVVSVTLFLPYCLYRKAAVQSKVVVLSSLYRSWTIPLPDVQEVEIVYDDQTSRGKRLVGLRLLVTTRDQVHFRSVAVDGLTPGEPKYRNAVALFERLADELRQKRGRGKGNQREP
jgi:hypothetical protein